MAGSITVASVVGARPQFVKLAPIVKAMNDSDAIIHRIVHTGQHYDENMSASFFEQLALPPPDIDLGVGSGGHAEQTAAMLTKIEDYLLDACPDAVLVYGDTNSTLSATLAAAKIHIPVAHVEAGLRSFNRDMPEEINRLVADHCADRLYAPTPQALQNLAAENLAGRSVLSGDVMLDAILRNIELARSKSTALSDHGLEPGAFALATVHRPVNTTAEALQRLLQVFERTVERYLPVVLPVHPRTRAILDQLGYQPPEGLRLLEPLPYLDVITMIQAAAVVITDSGGVQKEAAFLQTPCLTLRDETEWTETVSIGVNKLVGEQGRDLLDAVSQFLESPGCFDEIARKKIEEHYGNGNAATVIVDDFVRWLS